MYGRTAKLQLHTPLWVKLLPLVFVALIAYGLATGEHEDRSEPRDVTTQVRPG